MGTAPQHTRNGLLGGAALLLVLLGVLAMHGLGGHSATGHSATGHGGPPEAAHEHSVVTTVVGHAAHGAADAAEHLATGDPDAAAWTALCLAVLAGAVLLSLATRPGPVLRFAPARPGAASRPPGRRDRDPPSLVALSVRRC